MRQPDYSGRQYSHGRGIRSVKETFRVMFLIIVCDTRSALHRQGRVTVIQTDVNSLHGWGQIAP